MLSCDYPIYHRCSSLSSWLFILSTSKSLLRGILFGKCVLFVSKIKIELDPQLQHQHHCRKTATRLHFSLTVEVVNIHDTEQHFWRNLKTSVKLPFCKH